MPFQAKQFCIFGSFLKRNVLYLGLSIKLKKVFLTNFPGPNPNDKNLRSTYSNSDTCLEKPSLAKPNQNSLNKNSRILTTFPTILHNFLHLELFPLTKPWLQEIVLSPALVMNYTFLL